MSDLDAKLAEVARQYDDVQAELSRPEVSADPSEIRRLGQELARLEPVVEAFRRLEAVRAELAGAARAARRRRRRRGDARDGARRDRPPRGRRGRDCSTELKVLLLPRDPNDDRDVILEIRAGAGGEEAALFATELLRMYLRYADAPQVHDGPDDLNETGIGGIKEAIVQIPGDGAYSRLKFEGGVHRVQRVPVDRVVRADPHLDRDGRRHARGRRGRDRDRRGPRPPDRRQALVGARRPVGQHDRLGGAHHPPADRARRRDPGREEPAQEQGQGALGAALAAARPGAAEPARRRLGGAPLDGRIGRPLREGPDLQLPAGPGDRPPHRHDRARPAGRPRGRPRPLIDALVMARPGRSPRRTWGTDDAA